MRRLKRAFDNRIVTHVRTEACARRLDGGRIGAGLTAGTGGDPLDPRSDLALAQYDPGVS